MAIRYVHRLFPCHGSAMRCRSSLIDAYITSSLGSREQHIRTATCSMSNQFSYYTRSVMRYGIPKAEVIFRPLTKSWE